MRESTALVDAWRRLCDGISHSRAELFDELVSLEATSIIGTAPGETITDRAGLRFGFETEGITLTPRRPRGFEEGSLGWVVDEPRFGFPDGSGMDCRVTAIARREAEAWRLVHAHFSVGVPDDEVAELQQRWAEGADQQAPQDG